MELFVNKNQLAQEMWVAEAVSTVQFKIGTQAVVDKAAFEGNEEPEGIDCFASAFGMDAIPGEIAGRDDMEPMGRFHDP